MTKKVQPKRTATSNARGAHNACRTQEDKDIPDRDVQCTEPEYQDKTVCDADQDWYNNGRLMAWPPNGPKGFTNGPQVAFELESDETDLIATIAQAGKCVNYLELGIVCDANQRKFEADFCLYSQELRDTCSTHHSCYTKGVADKAVTVANVQELEAAQKMVWVSLQKIYCYMNKLKDAGIAGKNPTAADIQTCTDLQPSKEPLDIDYPAEEPETYCDQTTVEFQPGDARWKSDEYGKAPFTNANIGKVDTLGNYVEMESITACSY